MKFSTLEEYGLRCLIQIARHGQGASLTIAQLSQLEGISTANVGKIMRLLRRGRFVKSTRGQTGGYSLALPAEELSVGEVLASLGTRLFDAKFCERNAGSVNLCAHVGDCSIRPVLRQLQDAVDEVMGRLTLAELLRGDGRSPAAPPATFGRRVRVLPTADARGRA
jgi:Rrf2 family protein